MDLVGHDQFLAGNTARRQPSRQIDRLLEREGGQAVNRAAFGVIVGGLGMRKLADVGRTRPLISPRNRLFLVTWQNSLAYY